MNLNDGFEFIINGNLEPVEDVSDVLAKNSHLSEYVNALYLADRSTPEIIRISPVFAATYLKQAGLEVYLELAFNNYALETVVSLLMGAPSCGINKVVIYNTDPVEDESTFGVLDDLNASVEMQMRAVDGGEPLEWTSLNLFFNGGYEIFNKDEFFFENLKLTGFRGFMVPENYDPVKLMSLFSFGKEYGLQVINTATIYDKYRKLKFAHKTLPQFDIPDSFLDRVKNATGGAREGLEYFAEFVNFIQNFESNGLLIENTDPRTIRQFHDRFLQ
ncbi:MAG: hypothetical protein ACTSUE_10025 [Promethearchaeota archaeon]